MIVINDLNQINKYLYDVANIDNPAVKHIEVYRFETNGELDDVVFNCEVPYGTTDLYDIHFVGNDLFNIDMDKSTLVANTHHFIAKSFVFNKRFGVTTLDSLNTVVANDNCEIETCTIQNGTIIARKSLICENLNADGFSAKDLYFDKEVIQKYDKKMPYV